MTERPRRIEWASPMFQPHCKYDETVTGRNWGTRLADGSSEVVMKSSRPLPKRSNWRRILPGGLALALIAGACTSDDAANGADQDRTDTTTLSLSEISLTSGLETAQDCPSLLDSLVAEGMEHVGPFGFNNGYWGFPMEGEIFGGDDVDFAMEDEAMEATSSDSSGSLTASASGDAEAGGEGGFSGTNNQEVGVDEPDLVKTDGERLVIANGSHIRVLTVGEGAPELERTITLQENVWANELFLTGDRILVMSNGWTQESLVSSDFLPNGTNITQLTEIDITTGDVLNTLEFEGSYLSARDVDGTARIVLSAQTGNSFPFVFPSNDAARDSAEKANQDIIANSTIDQWLPNYRVTDGNGQVVESGPIVDCDRMHLPSGFSGFGTVAVLTIDLNEGLVVNDSLAVLTDGQTIYASPDTLAVASNRWPEWDPETGNAIEDDSTNVTSVHTFDITDSNETTYSASGAVRGFVLNQFSMSAHEGLLRIATTDTPPWNNGEQEDSESFVTVLGEEGGVLETIGQVGGLGEGEQIFSVRFIEDTAYVVTFRQVDPLYTVDLSDPATPTVLGELKIPGFSTYLHPVGEGRLLGIGQDADETGFQTGAQISSFDVADLADPTRTDQLGLGENSYSGIDWDKKAFTWWAPTNTAFVPISWWNYDEETQSEDNGAAVVVVTVAEDGTLVEQGRVEHPQLRSCEGPNGYTEELIISESSTGRFIVAPEEEDKPEQEDAEADLVLPEEEEDRIEPAPDAPDAEPAPEEEIEPYFPEGEEYCWSYAAEIRRSVIVGDQLLTISENGVLASNLDDLSAIGWTNFDR